MIRPQHLFLGGILACITACTATEHAERVVSPTFETRNHYDDAKGNFTDVDDPAIWVHPTDPARSVVAATLKEGGLDVYDMRGKLLQHIPPRPAPACSQSTTSCDNRIGRLNNADVVYNFMLNGKVTDLIVASDRGYDSLAVFRVTESDNGSITLTDVSPVQQTPIFSRNQTEINDGRTAYGLAVSSTDSTRAFVTRNDSTEVAVLELYDNGRGQVAYRPQSVLKFPRTFTLGNGNQWTPCTENDDDRPHFEGMVADIDNNALYLGQEDVGLWRVALDNPTDKNQWQLFGKVASYGGSYQRTWDASEDEYICTSSDTLPSAYGDAYLRADVEGLTLYDAGKGEGYLLVSSQGDNTVAVFDRRSNAWLGSFTVADGDVDAVNETDGMMVLNNAFPGTFERGVLIMQDGKNKPDVLDEQGQPRVNSNFKYVDWGVIARKLGLKIDTVDRTR